MAICRLPVTPALLTFLLGAALSTAPRAQDTYEPLTTWYGLRGLSQTGSAQSMGADRLTLSGRGGLYQQQRVDVGTPGKDANVGTGLASAAFGLNDFVDLYLGGTYFNISNADTGNGHGPGSLLGGIQASLPLPPGTPIHLAAQLSGVAGTASRELDARRPDGYDFLETRKESLALGRLLATLVFGDEDFGLRLHFNEGLAVSFDQDRAALQVAAAGLEFIPHPMVGLGLELNSRTGLQHPSAKDPLWITPSVTLRTPAHLNLQAGADFALSGDRDDGTRALEPWRLFGGLVFSYDLMAESRREAAEKAKRDSLERLRLADEARRNQMMADSLARKAHQDSLSLTQAQEAERRRADSLALVAKKAWQDSVAMAQALAEERSHRTDWEKEFLRTGVLNLEALYFETGKAVISINSKPYLNLVGKMLSKYPKLQLEIAGHTDNVGRPASNMRLSQDRADAVRLYLMQQFPDLGGRMAAKGYGPNMPKASNSTAEGRQINRRVEIIVLNKDVLKEYAQ